MKFLEGSVGHQIRLCFRNKCQMIDLLFTQLTSYRNMLERELKRGHKYVENKATSS